MMDMSLLFAYVITVFMLIATPGPVVFLVVNTALRSGPYRAFSTILGTNWASLVLIVIAVFIISGSLVINPKLFDLISLFGCVFIAYMAICSIQDIIKPKSKETMLERDATDLTNQESVQLKALKSGGILNGFLVGLSNPKDIIFFVSFFPQFIKITDSFNKSIFLLTLLWILLDFMILVFYIVFMRKMTSHKVKNLTILISSIILLVVAIIGFSYSLIELTV